MQHVKYVGKMRPTAIKKYSIPLSYFKVEINGTVIATPVKLRRLIDLQNDYCSNLQELFASAQICKPLVMPLLALLTREIILKLIPIHCLSQVYIEAK